MKKELPPFYRRHLSRQRRQSQLGGRGSSPRALFLGLLLVLTVCLAAPYSIWMVGSSEITWSYFPIGVGAPFFLVVLLNALVRRWRPRGALQPSELVTVAVMGLAASGMPIFVVGYILSIISKPYYGALPENKWAELVQPHLPQWALPSPADGAMRYFYEGLPSKTAAIPWGVWLGPLLWWLSLILALYLVCFCLSVVMRRQWMERERLPFPLIEVPLLLAQSEAGRALPPLLRTRAFWLGCAVPLSIILFNMVGYFFPGWAPIPVFGGSNLKLFEGAPAVPLLLYFPVVGFTYLVSTAVSFSVWFFWLLYLGAGVLLAQLGSPPLAPDPFVYGAGPLSWQSWGAFWAMALWGLWMARDHPGTVLGNAFGGAEIDDRGEVVSYRLAVGLGLGAAGYMLFWLWRSGMDLPVAAFYLLAALIAFLGLTRLVVQAGLHYLTIPMTPQSLTLALTGTGIGPQNLVALALAFSWTGDVQSTFMPSAANSLKLHDSYQQRRSWGLIGALGLAVGVGFFATALFILYLCYDHGAGHLRSWFFNIGGGAGGRAFNGVVQQLQEPRGTDWVKLGHFGFGSALYSLVALLHYRLPWWPLHPIGLAVASTWMMRRIAVSVFVAWLLKVLILRLGGPGLYARLKPFFVGLVVGFMVGVVLAAVVDGVWFRGAGHPILHG